MEFAIGAMAGFLPLLWFMVTFTSPDLVWMREAIKHGAAQYNPKTGIFEWKQPADAATE